MNNKYQLFVAQRIIDAMFKVEKVIIISDAPFEVDVHFSGNRSIRVTGKFAADIIKAGDYTPTGRKKSTMPQIQRIPKKRNTTKTISLWSEGYSATGGEMSAQFHGNFEAVDLKDAVKQFKETLPEDQQHYISSDYVAFWGCRFFDNEADARKSFG